MRQIKLYRNFPKPRFYVLFLLVATILSVLFYSINPEESLSVTIYQAIYLSLAIAGFMTVMNCSGTFIFIVQKTDGYKYFRLFPNAYAEMKKAMILNDIFGVEVAAAVGLLAVPMKLNLTYGLALTATEILVLIANRVAFWTRSQQTYVLLFGGFGGAMGGLMAAFSLGKNDIPEAELLPAAVIAVSVLAAVWVVFTVVLYAKLPKLWNRE